MYLGATETLYPFTCERDPPLELSLMRSNTAGVSHDCMHRIASADRAENGQIYLISASAHPALLTCCTVHPLLNALTPSPLINTLESSTYESLHSLLGSDGELVAPIIDRAVRLELHVHLARRDHKWWFFTHTRPVVPAAVVTARVPNRAAKQST